MDSNRPSIKVIPPGPKSKEIYEILRAYEYPAEYVTNYDLPLVMCEGSGFLLKDLDGNTYLDFTSGFAALAVGHSHPKLLDAAFSQMKMLQHTAQIPTEPRARLAKRLVEILPGNLKNNSKLVFAVGGSEAVEIALKSARVNKDRPVIISFFGGYHGRGGAGAMDVTSEAWFHKGLHPTRPGVVELPYAYCYRCYFGREYPECGLFCLEYIRRVLSDSKCGLRNVKKGVNHVAAIILEPAQGSSGYVIPPKEFWPGIRKICDECDILMIDDEVQMGWGRSGRMFCIENWDVVPDMITLGKGITGGMYPMGVTVGRRELIDKFEPNYHGVTYGGNPVGCAIALAMIELLHKEKLPEHAAELGKYFFKELKELESEHPLIGHVDGMGFMIGIELVKDRRTKEPASEEAMKIVKEAIKRGLLLTISGYYGNRINIVPPLIIQKEQVDVATEILSSAIHTVEREPH